MDNVDVSQTGAGQDRRVALKCALVAVVLTAIPVRLAIQAAGEQPSGLIRMASVEPIARLALEGDPEFAFVDIGAHYDGVYYYAIARDPVARGEAHELIDKSAYRYGHAGYGWLAALLSLGNPRLIPGALISIALLGMALAAWATSTIFRDFGFSGWWGLTIALNPGLIYAATAVTSEPIGVAILLLGLLLWLRDRTRPAAILIAALCFFKEPFVMVPVGLAAYELIELMRGRRRSDLVERLSLLAVGPALFAGWYLYLYQTFGRWPFTDQEGFFQFPFAGWIQSIQEASKMARGPFFESQLGAPSAAFIAAVAGLLIIGFVAAIRWRSSIHTVFFPLAVVVACLSPLGVLYPKDLIREVAAPIALVPLVLAAGSGAPRDGTRFDHDHIPEPPEG